MITIKPIKTEADYASALAHIEKLWGAAPDTEEGDELDVLITLVEAYEAKHYPIAPPDEAVRQSRLISFQPDPETDLWETNTDMTEWH